jgi:hypothetical protein
MLALIVLARLVEVGVEELARHIGDARTRPAIGERLMWTSNTLMKIDTRVNSPRRPPSPASSGGGGPWLIIVTSPSAGATISLDRRGVVRIGSRKKAATQIVTPISSQPRKWLTGCRSASAMNAAMTVNLRPSGWTEGKRHLTVVRWLSGLSSGHGATP